MAVYNWIVIPVQTGLSLEYTLIPLFLNMLYQTLLENSSYSGYFYYLHTVVFFHRVTKEKRSPLYDCCYYVIIFLKILLHAFIFTDLLCCRFNVISTKTYSGVCMWKTFSTCRADN